MARTEARILVSIWNDPDFRAVGADAQWAYMFLLSQPDLAHDGVLPLRVRRWAQASQDMSTARLGEALRALERARFIVADRDTEELLIRSFIRGDGVYLQPNLLRAARKHLPTVVSPTIRAALAVELARLLPDATPRAKAEVEAMLDDLAKTAPDPPVDASPNPSPEPSPNPSSNPSRTPLGDRGVVTVVSTDAPSPYPLDPLPYPLPLASLAADVSPSETSAPTAQTLVAEWIDHCRVQPAKRTVGAVAKQVKALLDDGLDPDHIRAGLDLWRRKGADPSVLHSFVNQAANAEPRASPNGRASPSTGDLRMGDALAAGQRAQARLDANTRKELEPP
jgi:hypothetical protein